MSQLIKLPAERHRQLEILADRDGMSIADVIGDFIRKAIFDERLPAELPGWTVEKIGRRVHFAILDTGISRKLTPASAVSLADALDSMAVAGISRGGFFDVEVMLKVERRGTSVRIVDAETGETRAVARSIAEDIAGLLRKAAA